MESKFAAVWGSPGSGKTLTAVKIAKALSENKENVLIVGCDDETPLLPLLLPSASETQSLGGLLALPALSQIAVLQHCVPFGKSEYISLLGYKLEENVMSYSEYSLQRAKELFSLLRRLADYVIADCSSHLTDNILSAAALETADVTFKVVNADLKSTVYIRSQKLLLQDSRFRYKDQINILNNVLPSQDTCPIREALGGVCYTLPHMDALKEQYDTGRLLDTVFGREAKQYEPVIKAIGKEVLEDEPEHGIIRRRKAAVGDVSGTA
jgi:MinD-like ATPase involved in chromosome partitioning or flagellar assembly